MVYRPTQSAGFVTPRVRVRATSEMVYTCVGTLSKSFTDSWITLQKFSIGIWKIVRKSLEFTINIEFFLLIEYTFSEKQIFQSSIFFGSLVKLHYKVNKASVALLIIGITPKANTEIQPKCVVFGATIISCVHMRLLNTALVKWKMSLLVLDKYSPMKVTPMTNRVTNGNTK